MVPMLELQHELRNCLKSKELGDLFDGLAKDRM